ncbi:protein TALPID3-like [Oscarella lobularis]|uniref:protein TALPID3-like n=1 Tax=Oscarella lobularis TaxID=121494 RepID=UPI0033139305
MLTEIEAGPRERIPRPSPKTELLTVTLAAVNDIEGSMEDDAGSNSSRRASIEAKEADESPPHSSFTDLSLTDDDSGSTITNLGSGSSIRRVRLPTGNLREIDSPYVVAGSSPVVTTNESTNDVPSPLPISKESDIVTSDEREPKRQSGSGLRQGVETKTARQMQGGTFRDRDVIVSATASCKQRRLVFAKKHDAKQAVAKRTVQPKRVLLSRPQISESPVKKKNDGDSLPADQTSTAAAATAAAAAAAATAATAAITSSGPYVQASQALTSQVAGLVSQLHALRDRQEADMTARQRRFQEQADRYADVRLGQLERLHERHADIQAQLARTVTHSHPPPPPPPVVSAPPQSLLPVDGDILATPLPRRVTPVPTRSDCLRTRQTVVSDTDSSCLDGMEDGRKREEIVSIDNSSSLESATAVQTSAARRNENRFCRMEHRLELLKKQLVDLRTRTTEWRQRNNGRSLASAPVFLSTIDQRWLDAEDILARCNESRRNLDDNLEAIRREHEARSLYDIDPFTRDGTLDSIRRDVARNVEAIRREIHVEIARESSSRRAVSFARDEQVDGSKTKKKKQNFARRTGSAYVRKLPSKRKEVATIDSKTKGKKTGNKPVKAPFDRKQPHFVPPTAVRHKTVAFEPRAAPAVAAAAAARIIYPTAIPLSVPRQAWSDEAKSDATDDGGTSNRIDVAIQAGRSDGGDNADRVLPRLTLEALPHVSIDANERDQPTQRSDTASDVVRKFDHFARVDAYPGNDDDDDDAGGDKAELQEDEEEIFTESEARLQETVELEGGRLPNVDRAALTLTGQPPRVEGHFVVAAAEEQSNDVEQFAREWIERELKARVDVQHRPESGDVSVDESASFSDEEAALSSSIVRIFAEARLSVDEDLVDRLKRAVVTDMVSKAWRRQTAAATGVEHEKKTPPLSSQSSSSTVATPLPTRSPSPAASVEEEEDRVVQSQKVATPSVTPPPSPVDQEIPLRSESEREEEEDGDVLSPFKSPFIDQAVTTRELTPSDTASSNKSSIPGDDVAQISTPCLSEEERNDDDENGGGGHSFVESENLETPSRQVVNLVVAETQTSEHNNSVSLRSPTYSLSVSGTSSLTSSSAASSGDRPDHTTTALSTTDAEISEGEYLLVRPPPSSSSPEATTAKGNELSEGEFPASPGDVRLTKRPKGQAVSKEAFDGEQFQGDVRGFLEAFLEQSPEETALSATDSSSASLSVKAKRGVNFARELVEVAQLGDENDVSLGEVIGADNSKRAEESEDLSYGEAVRPAVASEAIKEGVLFLASGSIDDGNSPGEIRRKVAQGVGVETREEPSEMSAHSPGERPHAPTNNGREMRSLFSKSARDRRPVRRQPGRNETAFLPSVVQVPSISRRVLVAAARSPAPDDDMAAAAASTSDVKFSESFRGEDTYSEVSSLSYSGMSGQAD